MVNFLVTKVMNVNRMLCCQFRASTNFITYFKTEIVFDD